MDFSMESLLAKGAGAAEDDEAVYEGGCSACGSADCCGANGCLEVGSEGRGGVVVKDAGTKPVLKFSVSAILGDDAGGGQAARRAQNGKAVGVGSLRKPKLETVCLLSVVFSEAARCYLRS